MVTGIVRLERRSEDDMKNPVRIVTGVIITLLGLLFMFQGLGVVHGSSMTNSNFWAVAGPVIAIGEELPESVAAAVIDVITGSLLDNPQRVGRELRNELAGIHSARRGTFRILYRINEKQREVTVLRVDRRRDVYRT